MPRALVSARCSARCGRERRGRRGGRRATERRRRCRRHSSSVAFSFHDCAAESAAPRQHTAPAMNLHTAPPRSRAACAAARRRRLLFAFASAAAPSPLRRARRPRQRAHARARRLPPPASRRRPAPRRRRLRYLHRLRLAFARRAAASSSAAALRVSTESSPGPAAPRRRSPPLRLLDRRRRLALGVKFVARTRKLLRCHGLVVVGREERARAAAHHRRPRPPLRADGDSFVTCAAAKSVCMSECAGRSVPWRAAARRAAAARCGAASRRRPERSSTSLATSRASCCGSTAAAEGARNNRLAQERASPRHRVGSGRRELGCRIEYAAPPAATSPTPCSVRPPKQMPGNRRPSGRSDQPPAPPIDTGATTKSLPPVAALPRALLPPRRAAALPGGAATTIGWASASSAGALGRELGERHRCSAAWRRPPGAHRSFRSSAAASAASNASASYSRWTASWRLLTWASCSRSFASTRAAPRAARPATAAATPPRPRRWRSARASSPRRRRLRARRKRDRCAPTGSCSAASSRSRRSSASRRAAPHVLHLARARARRHAPLGPSAGARARLGPSRVRGGVERARERVDEALQLVDLQHFGLQSTDGALGRKSKTKGRDQTCRTRSAMTRHRALQQPTATRRLVASRPVEITPNALQIGALASRVVCPTAGDHRFTHDAATTSRASRWCGWSTRRTGDGGEGDPRDLRPDARALRHIAFAHRTGAVRRRASVEIVVSSTHRKRSRRYAIDELKAHVPIWKEVGDGEACSKELDRRVAALGRAFAAHAHVAQA